MQWRRHHPGGYEVSSKGDQRFSALFATLSDGRTIEQAYQLDIKGYRKITNDWRDAKGQAPLNGKTRAELWTEYLLLWRIWAAENPSLIAELRTKAKVLTDMFASTTINQAHALSVLCTELEDQERLPFKF